MTKTTTGQNHSVEDQQLSNRITIVGRGVPSNYELAVSGKIEINDNNPVEEGVIISGGVAEGSIDVGVQQFRFSGKQIHVHLVDWNGIEAPDSSCTPIVNIEYDITK